MFEAQLQAAGRERGIQKETRVVNNDTARLRIGALFLTATIFSAGCAKMIDEEAEDLPDPNAEIIENLRKAGFSENNIEVREGASLVDGRLVFDEQVYLEGNVHITLDASREMISDEVGDSFRHWRTPNLVTPGSRICLAKVRDTASGYEDYELTSHMHVGVERAAYNYSQVTGLDLRFRTGDASIESGGQFSHSMTECDHVIYIYQHPGSAGGSSGFPAGGAPYSSILLYTGLENLGYDVHEHVVTALIGHTIGLRHSDWQTRESCGQYVSESQDGAIHIPGTAGNTTNSIMAACFSTSTDGEFRGEDEEALEKLYPTHNMFDPDADTLAVFELNGNASDSSGNGRHATILGGGTFVDTEWGQGLDLSADPQALDWSAYASMLEHPYTVEMVLTPGSLSTRCKLFSAADNSDYGWYFDANKFLAHPDSTEAAIPVFDNNDYQYLAIVSTSANQIDIYLDGVFVFSTQASFTAPPSEAIFFRDDTVTGRNEQIGGVVDGVRISSVARTIQEIRKQSDRLGDIHALESAF